MGIFGIFSIEFLIEDGKSGVSQNFQDFHKTSLLASAPIRRENNKMKVTYVQLQNVGLECVWFEKELLTHQNSLFLKIDAAQKGFIMADVFLVL